MTTFHICTVPAETWRRRAARDAGYFDAENYLASPHDFADGIAARLLDRNLDARNELLALAQALRDKAARIHDGEGQT